MSKRTNNQNIEFEMKEMKFSSNSNQPDRPRTSSLIATEF
jgi:hypothetical protein